MPRPTTIHLELDGKAAEQFAHLCKLNHSDNKALFVYRALSILQLLMEMEANGAALVAIHDTGTESVNVTKAAHGLTF